jgi:deoxyribodipyrimidine photo-lyase
VVTDDYPAFFLPRMIRAAAGLLAIRCEAIDSNGLLPLRAGLQVYTSAYSFRSFLQKHLPDHLGELPGEDPFSGTPLPRLQGLPQAITRRWPCASVKLLSCDPGALLQIPIDHEVPPAPIPGGAVAAGESLNRFIRAHMSLYPSMRNHPDEECTSGLSPYLHFGHISVHEVFARICEEEEWSPERLGVKATGKRAGWWGMSEGAEAFLDELITWRELGFNRCSRRDDYDRLASLPDWALKDLMSHAGDRRPYLYTLEEFSAAGTHDTLWNAAQRQLLGEGRIHNYLRMLWGKKILEWSRSPQDALDTMIELNNRWALDGRDPNSYSGIFWVLGRYDRPWFPERPVYGRVRYMSSRNTLRKVRLQEYLHRFGQ